MGERAPGRAWRGCACRAVAVPAVPGWVAGECGAKNKNSDANTTLALPSTCHRWVSVAGTRPQQRRKRCTGLLVCCTVQ